MTLRLTILQRISLALHQLTPQRLLTWLAGSFAKAKLGFVTHGVIWLFSKFYKIDLQQAKLKKPEDYETFNEFFTRALEDGSRPIADDSLIISPAEGKVSQSGKIDGKFIIQAKNHYYLVADLIGDQEAAQSFNGGSFINIYLSPKDYHNVHMPIDGKLTKTIFIPGDLYSVSPLVAQEIPQVFARNERLVCFFDTELGPMVQVLVGATITGSINTSWAGVVNLDHSKEIKVTDYSAEPINLNKGDVMGAFLLGSTVITLFSDQQLNLIDFAPQSEILVNQTIANFN